MTGLGLPSQQFYVRFAASENISGSLLHHKLISWGFKASIVDNRIHLKFYKYVKSFMIISSIVDYLLFASKNRRVLELYK